MFTSVLMASRPISWINTAFPFAAGYLMVTREIDTLFVVGTVFFLIPYNLLMYGINDVFDYESDLANPRKGGIEGAVADRTRAAQVHRAILLWSLLSVVPFSVWMMTLSDAAAAATLALVIGTAVAYSAPVLRFKERAFVDSATSATHFMGPLLYGLVAAHADLGSAWVWPILAAFFLWGMASHALGAVQDIQADRSGGIGSVATVIGARSTVRLSVALYVAAAVLLLALPWPGMLASVLPLPYAVSAARFWNIDDARAPDAHGAWKTFLWLNQPVGFVVTMLLIAVWNGWL